MSHTVKRRFRCLETFKFYNKGDSYKHDNEHRISELVDKGFLEGKAKKEPKKESKETKESPKKKTKK